MGDTTQPHRLLLVGKMGLYFGAIISLARLGMTLIELFICFYVVLATECCDSTQGEYSSRQRQFKNKRFFGSIGTFTLYHLAAHKIDSTFDGFLYNRRVYVCVIDGLYCGALVYDYNRFLGAV